MMISAALALLMLCPVQDDARIQELIRKLDDDSLEARQQAQIDLSVLGAPAIPHLRKAIETTGASTELKARGIATIRAIERTVQAAKVYRDPLKITLKADGAGLREVLDKLARQGDVKIDSSAVDDASPVTLNVRDAPLMQVLDHLCAGQEQRSWEHTGEGTIRFLKEPHPAFPSDYVGPFRLRARGMRMERSTDFKVRTATLAVSIEAEWERYLKPFQHVEILVTKASDDRASVLQSASEEVPVEMQLLARDRIMKDRSAEIVFLKGLHPDARQVTMEGAARFSFPLESRELRFDGAKALETQEAGDASITLHKTGGDKNFWMVTFLKQGKNEAGSWDRSVAQRLDLESLWMVDIDGGETRGQLLPMLASGMQLPRDTTAAYQIVVRPAVFKPAREVRFRFISQTFVKTIPFKLSLIP